jgi:hypothetical protein
MNPAKERSTEGFDLPTWRSRVADWWRESAPDLPGVMQRLGLNTAYGALVASAWLPLLAAYADDPGRAVTALVGLVSGVGSNLVANVVQGAYDQANAPRQAESEVAERPELRSEYQQLLNGLDVLDVARAALSADWTPFEAQLREELTRMGGQVRLKTKGGAVVFGDVKVKYGDFVGRDKIVHLHFGPPEPDLAPLREAYLRLLVERHGRLPLRGVDVQASDATAQAQRPRLAQVYVELNTSSSVVENDESGRHKPRHVEEAVALGKEDAVAEARRLSALEAVLENRHLILLGAPGSGKSTFVCHLACCLGLGQQEPGQGWLERLSGWPEAEAGALPLVVTLRDFARWAGAQGLNRGTARALDDFIASWLGEHSLGELTGSLRQALRGGQAVVLLDGLDEVPTPELRALVRDAVSDFGLVYKRARLLVTCRTLSYQDPRWRLDPTRFPSFELAPFDEEQIDRFIAAWYAELAALKAVRAEDVDALATKLRGAVRQPDLWRLASNPLLLTVMALVHAYQGRLPEARALLYEECTDLLLWRWEQVKWQADLAVTPGVRALLAEAHLQEVDLKGALWELAFDAHSASADGGDEEATIDIPEERLLRALRGLHPDKSWDWAAEVVAQIKERAGLLVERDLEVYAFPHRTFQEYLAGCHLSVQADFSQRAAALLEEAAFWREAVLLAVGRLVHVMGDLPRPLSLVAELCPPEATVDEKTWLAGEVLLEVGAERAGRTAMGRELLERVRRRLAALLAGGHLAPRERAEAGVVLGKLGDPRPGITLLPSRPGVTAPPPRLAGGTEGGVSPTSSGALSPAAHCGWAALKGMNSPGVTRPAPMASPSPSRSRPFSWPLTPSPWPSSAPSSGATATPTRPIGLRPAGSRRKGRAGPRPATGTTRAGTWITIPSSASHGTKPWPTAAG